MINTAIIGLGDMGTKYAAMILKDKTLGLNLTAGTRIKEKNLNTIKELLPSDFKFYNDDKELFEAFDRGEFKAQAVIIVTPHYAHEYSVKEAFKRNLNVLCDKPAGVYLRQGIEMLNAKPQDKSYGFIFHQRMYPINQKLKEIVESAKYGKVKRISYTITDWYRTNAYYKSSAWRATWKTDGGGTLLNQCPHSIDLLCWLFGMPQSVYCSCYEGKYHPIQVEDEATAFIEWADGKTGVFIASTGENPGVNRLEISFEKAVLKCENDTIEILENPLPESEYRTMSAEEYKAPVPQKTVYKFDGGKGDAYQQVLKAFSGSIINGEKLVADGKDSIMSLYFANACYLSSHLKKPVTFHNQGTVEISAFEKDFENWLAEKSSI